jgi:hypothetical protein
MERRDERQQGIIASSLKPLDFRAENDGAAVMINDALPWADRVLVDGRVNPGQDAGTGHASETNGRLYGSCREPGDPRLSSGAGSQAPVETPAQFCFRPWSLEETYP